MIAVKKLFIKNTRIKLKIIQMIHPIRLKVTDSTRNWRRISLLCAPIALRIQISLILSVTETSIIFITQIPPTSNDIAAIPASRAVNIQVILLTVVIISL
ncbi:MAG: hypothetical protein WCP92_05880 [bacterium]